MKIKIISLSVMCAGFLSITAAQQLPLHHAVETNNINELERLLDNRFDKNINIDEQDGDGATAFLKTAQYGKKEFLFELYRFGASTSRPNKAGQTPLHVAAQNGHTTTVAFLVAKDPSLAHLCDKNNNTPLHVAAQNGHALTMQALLSASSTPNRPNNMGQTALHTAASCKKQSALRCISTLLQNGAVVSPRDLSGATPLTYATQALVRQLNANGQRPCDNHQGPESETAASFESYAKNASALIAAGAHLETECHSSLQELHDPFVATKLRLHSLACQYLTIPTSERMQFLKESLQKTSAIDPEKSFAVLREWRYVKEYAAGIQNEYQPFIDLRKTSRDEYQRPSKVARLELAIKQPPTQEDDQVVPSAQIKICI